MLAEVNPQKFTTCTSIMPSVGRSEHLDLFEKGIAASWISLPDPEPAHFATTGRWPARNGAIHTYIELDCAVRRSVANVRADCRL